MKTWPEQTDQAWHVYLAEPRRGQRYGCRVRGNRPIARCRGVHPEGTRWGVPDCQDQDDE